jgi:hypothetical protein
MNSSTTLERAELIDTLLPPGAHQTVLPSVVDTVAPTQTFDVKLTSISKKQDIVRLP